MVALGRAHMAVSEEAGVPLATLGHRAGVDGVRPHSAVEAPAALAFASTAELLLLRLFAGSATPFAKNVP